MLFGSGAEVDGGQLVFDYSGGAADPETTIAALLGSKIYTTVAGDRVSLFDNTATDQVIVSLVAVPEPSMLLLATTGLLSLLGLGGGGAAGHAALSCAAVVVAMLIAGSAQADVFNMGGTRDPTTGTWTGAASLEFVPVGNPGNTADPATGNLYGSVGYTYQMGKYDVTVGQYCQFLNAVAKTDTYGLYTSCMTPTPDWWETESTRTIGITQTGSSGNYSYAVTGGYSQAVNCPIFDVNWGNAARFCNWLQNGQPAFPVGIPGEVAGSTETGAYTLNGNATNWMAVTRNAGAKYVIPSENEWYKAAYYDPNKPGGAGYWSYPTKSNTAPINILYPTGTNNANFYGTDTTNFLTPVGAFADSPGPYGTFDMGGDVFQWNETAVTGSSRGLRGGDWDSVLTENLAASSPFDEPPTGDSTHRRVPRGKRS